MRFRIIAVTAVFTALSLVVASPASAATITRTKVVRSLLTATELGAGWHKTDLGSGDGSEVTGCESADYESVGIRFEVEREFQYGEVPTYIAENVWSFRTRTKASQDFSKGVRLFSACSSFTMDGAVFRITRLSVADFADQEAAFRIVGSVPTAAGDVPLTMFIVLSRWGRQQVALMTMVGGQMTSAEVRATKTGSVRIARAATQKVAGRLGR
jgi:hypothetical protein